jgi:hypothetical protein
MNHATKTIPIPSRVRTRCTDQRPKGARTRNASAKNRSRVEASNAASTDEDRATDEVLSSVFLFDSDHCPFFGKYML